MSVAIETKWFAEADAALISAAPDLYVALDALLSIHRRRFKDDEAVRQAERALAKARGEVHAVQGDD